MQLLDKRRQFRKYYTSPSLRASPCRAIQFDLRHIFGHTRTMNRWVLRFGIAKSYLIHLSCNLMDSETRQGYIFPGNARLGCRAGKAMPLFARVRVNHNVEATNCS
jgi:hypothetical protein